MSSLKNNPEVLALVAEAKLKAEAAAYKAAIKAIKATQAPLLAPTDGEKSPEAKLAKTSIKASIAASVAAVQELTAAY